MVLRAIGMTLISFLLVLSMIIAIIGISLQTLLYPDIYLRSLEEAHGYEFIEGELIGESGLPEELVRGKVRPIVNELLGNALSYIRGEEEELVLRIDLKDSVRELMVERMRNMPVCEDDMEFIDGPSVECRPSFMEPEEFMELALAEFPDEIDGFTSIDLGEQIGEEARQVREIVVMLRKAVYAAIFVALSMILLIIMLTRKSFTKMAEWLDGDLFLVSIILFVLIYFVRDTLLSRIPNDPAIVQPLASGIVLRILDSVMLFAGIVAGIGVVILVSWVIWHELRRLRPAPKTTEGQ